LNSLFLRMAVIVVSTVSVAGAQQTAAEKYQAAFGPEDQAVRRSPETLDDLQFSSKLLKAARSSTNTRDFRVLLYEKVYEFAARRSSGYKQAIEAINYLNRAIPARRSEWLEKKLKTMTRRYVNSYGAGREEIAKPYLDTLLAVAEGKLKDGQTVEAQGLYRRAYSVALLIKSPLRTEIRAQAAKLTAAAALQRRTEQFKRALAAKPSIRNRENLIYHYLTELDNPKNAVELITDDVNKDLQNFVPLATASASELEAQGCMGLAKWYESLAKKPISPKGRLNVYRRAREYYNKYLSLSDKTGPEELLAKKAVTRLDKAMDKMDPNRLTIDCGGGVTMRLRRIQTGKFMMGSPPGEASRGSDEGPQVSIEISKMFYIGVTEVTEAVHRGYGRQSQRRQGTGPAGGQCERSQCARLLQEAFGRDEAKSQVAHRG